MTTLEKVKRLEQYMTGNDLPTDPVMDLVLNKLMHREMHRMRELKARLLEQLTAFEKNHALDTPTFYSRYEKGEMGDAIDFVEWSATWEMLLNLDKRITLLEAAPAS